MCREGILRKASSIALACLLMAAATATSGAEREGFAGVVRDGLGSVLADVEIFFLTDATSQTPVATVRSGYDGRFVVSDLPGGLYRIAAVKPGYGLYLGRVNTMLRSSLALVLQPIPNPGEPGSEAVPDDASWVLRVPDRSLLRDVVAVSVTPPGDVRPEDNQIGPGTMVRGDVVQSFAVESPFGNESGAVQGSETGFALGGPLGSRATVRLAGARQSLQSVVGVAEPGRLSSAGSAHMRVGMRYQASRDGDLRVLAHYADRDVRFSPEVEGVLNRTRQAARSWGYDALWSQELDATSRFDVRMDYRDVALLVPGGHPADEAGEWVEGSHGSTASVRSVGAGGSYQTLNGTRHFVRVGFDARFLDHPVPQLRDTLPSEVYTSQTPGWSVRLSAEDAWAVHGPWTMTYGVGYRHIFSDGESSLIVPRIGATWSSRVVSMGVFVSHHALRNWDGQPATETMPDQIDGVGYDARVETRIGRDLSLLGSISSKPVEFDYPGVDTLTPTAFGLRREFASDGHAANEEFSVALRQQNGQTQTYVQWVRGEARGMLAALPSFAMPYQLLAERQLHYDTGRFGVQVPGAGTDLVFEYRRRRDAPAGRVLADGFRHEEVELRLLQDLFRSQGGTSWRFLFGLQVASRDGEDPANPEDILLIPDSHQQVNAGVAVAF